MTADAALAPARARRTFHPLVVAGVERLTDDAVALTLAVPDGLREAFAFVPGQHLTLRTELGGVEVRRSYSICAPRGGPLRVAVKRLAGGAFSAWANDELRPGAVLDVLPPAGRFGAGAQVPGGSYVAVAAGSGITPVLSLVTTVLGSDPDARVALLYGNRTTAEVMFLEELADLKDRHPARLQLVHVLSREPLGAELLSGRIDTDRLGRVLDALVDPGDVDAWWLCGPQGMVEGAREVLAARGVAPGRVHAELFHVEGAGATRVAPPPGAGPQDAATVTVRLDGRSTTLRLPPAGAPVLEALLAVRADAPYACKGGVCGTCRARVVEGEVRMERNYALERDEVDAGFVLACQSHPVTPSVVLDFDA